VSSDQKGRNNQYRDADTINRRDKFPPRGWVRQLLLYV